MRAPEFLWIFLILLTPIWGNKVSLCNLRITLDKSTKNERDLSFASSKQTLIYDSNRFCRKYGIENEECDIIRERYTQKCIDNADSQKIDTFESQEVHTVSSNEIDYSQKVGPILEVVVNGQSNSKLQQFKGESPQNAVNRFCGAYRLNKDDCKVVEDKFLSLLAPDSSAPFETKVDNFESVMLWVHYVRMLFVENITNIIGVIMIVLFIRGRLFAQ